jgi:hypothetical protein
MCSVAKRTSRESCTRTMAEAPDLENTGSSNSLGYRVSCDRTFGPPPMQLQGQPPLDKLDSAFCRHSRTVCSGFEDSITATGGIPSNRGTWWVPVISVHAGRRDTVYWHKNITLLHVLVQRQLTSFITQTHCSPALTKAPSKSLASMLEPSGE